MNVPYKMWPIPSIVPGGQAEDEHREHQAGGHNQTEL